MKKGTSALKQFVATVLLDGKLKKIRVNAANEDSAKYMVTYVKECPESAIVKIREARYNKK